MLYEVITLTKQNKENAEHLEAHLHDESFLKARHKAEAKNEKEKHKEREKAVKKAAKAGELKEVV